jgi:hypothetical protein
MPSASASARHDVRRASGSRGFRWAARSGFAVSGLLHVLIGAIAIAVAVGAGSQEADQSGALKQVAETPGGIIVIWICAVGLAALGLWEIVNGVLMPRGDDTKWTRRVASGGKAIAYGAICVTALSVALGARSSTSSNSKSLTATALATPGGVFLVIAIGLTVGIIGISFAVIGIRQGFRRDIRIPGGIIGVVTGSLGTFGYVAKGVALTVVGILFVVGALKSDASQTTGLDGALKALAALPFGEIVLFVVAIGLIAYGVFLGLKARYAKI